MKKKVDSRLKTLLENNIARRQRSLFVIVGDNGRYQVSNFYYLLSNMLPSKPSVLWCYKKDLGFSSNRKSRMKQLKKQAKKGKLDPNVDDPFELFISNSDIRYCYYKESSQILGRTFGICILQDFEALTPNILCQTIETVAGGGVICILLHTMSSLKSLYNTVMDFHERFIGNENLYSGKIISRFIPRLIYSFSTCPNCIIIDDEMNILPISKHIMNIKPENTMVEDIYLVNNRYSPDENKNRCQSFRNVYLSGKSKSNEYISLEESLAGTNVGKLIENCATYDQAQAVVHLMDTIFNKDLNATISLTSGRGRGKSAALGLALSGAISYGYSNIFITSPYPENVSTVFEFVEVGLISLGYTEHKHFELIRSKILTDIRVGGGKSHVNSHLIRINIFKEHRQTIQYISPEDYKLVSQAELVVMDEAAAIPLPIVRKFLGSHIFIMSSTTNGYEGTGRALSVKLISELKKSCSSLKNGIVDSNGISPSTSFKEINLNEPIRYGKGDPVEKWLYDLLCLDATSPPPLNPSINEDSRSEISTILASPSLCQLYRVNRDALFSHHPASEKFLHNMMSLFVSSHYKNTPNDLMLISEAPNHNLFVLLPPFNPDTKILPPILVAIQIAVEGALSSDYIKNNLSRGLRPSGDLIPWTLSNYFVRENFGQLTGIRVVRIATHPSIQRMGYGKHALQQLILKIESISTEDLKFDELIHDKKDEELTKSTENNIDSISFRDHLQKEIIEVNRTIPPLLEPLENINYILKPSENIDYIGTSFGVTLDLFKFWSKLEFIPVYIRQHMSDITGEHSLIMLRSFGKNWVNLFAQDFVCRIIQYLSSPLFNNFSTSLALSLVKSLDNSSNKVKPLKPSITKDNLHHSFTQHDCIRLSRYAKQMADFASIADLVPIISQLYFENRLTGVFISYIQAAILLGLGSQRKKIDEIAEEFNIPSSQLLALFNKAIHKINTYIQSNIEISIDSNKNSTTIDDYSLKASIIETAEENPIHNKIPEGTSPERTTSKDLTGKSLILDHMEEFEEFIIPDNIEEAVSKVKKPIESAKFNVKRSLNLPNCKKNFGKKKKV
ncbi:putative ATPase family protein [Cryptosporidium muris RN66]|uniref:RNA cytidine acetyltransferase n=1 Tax=Cryptosporidium muris (strain RN66) TaxID=441375 RepID=B6AB39_CRYMR|nr:putative ATPase family protein [Cryptosporidium muris RN66]EEA05591.1 putative ATPase family protein [Cryptosporidium muris RN66]|eukprot:XP_002139940.1 ATPase family protein [Cryptosporidium muris RN66]